MLPSTYFRVVSTQMFAAAPGVSPEGVHLDYGIPVGNKEASGECGLLLHWKVEIHIVC